MFCHGPSHSQESHRGQRVSGSVESVQFLDQIESFEWLQEIEAYADTRLQSVMDEVKEKLHALEDEEQRVCAVRIVSDEITRSGQAARKWKPAISRPRDYFLRPPEITTIAGLDGRLKWLQGTLRLMLRKIWKANPVETRKTELRNLVDELLRGLLHLPSFIPSGAEEEWQIIAINDVCQCQHVLGDWLLLESSNFEEC